MNEYNKEGQIHGPWEGYYSDGKIQGIGYYIN